MGEAKRRREAREKLQKVRPPGKSHFSRVLQAASELFKRKSFFTRLQEWLDARRPK